MPGMAKIGLDDDAAADEPGQRQPEDGHHREQRVAQRVLADDDLFGQALGARRLHVVLTHHLEHALPHVAGEAREPAEGGHRRWAGARWLTKSSCCRQNDRYSQFSERSPEMGSQPSWAPKSDMSRSASQKSGVANPTNTNTRGHLVEARALADGRQDADGHRHRQDDEHLDDVQQQGDRQPLADLGEHGLAVGQERAPEVEPRQPHEPAPVLDHQRLVEPVELGELLLHLRREVGALRLQEVQRPAGGERDHDEGDEGDADQQGHDDQEPPDEERPI